MRSFLLSMAMAALLTACQAQQPLEGEYTAMLRDVMAESAALRKTSGQEPMRSEQAERAVRAWRDPDENKGSSNAASPSRQTTDF